MIKFLFNQYKISQKKNLSRDRYSMNTLVIMNIILKILTFFPAYCLFKFKIRPDSITIISYISILLSSTLFVIGNPIYGCYLMLFFGFLDSLDGDLARLSKTKTMHGKNMDILGADIFYFLIPMTISIYIFLYQKIDFFFDDKFNLIIIGFIISFSFMFYRIVGLRNYVLSLENKRFKIKKKNTKIKLSMIKRMSNIYDHPLIRGNFFSEPGLILNFSILIFLGEYQLLYYYLYIIFLYTLIRILRLFIGTIIVYISK